MTAFTHRGKMFTFAIERDDDAKPWEYDDGAGIVNKLEGREARYKRPHERILVGGLFYDMQATMKKAKADDWGFTYEAKSRIKQKPEAHNWTEFAFKLWYAGLTRGQRAEIAVELDFQRMADWCKDKWHYIGVIVTHEATGHKRSLWRIESDDEDCIEETMEELADELIDEFNEVIKTIAA